MRYHGTNCNSRSRVGGPGELLIRWLFEGGRDTDFKKCREIRISSIFFLFSGLDQGADDTNSAILTNCHTFRIILVITLSSKYTNCTKYCDAGGGSPLSRYYRGLSRYYCRCRELPSRYNCHLSLLMKNVKASPILERSI